MALWGRAEAAVEAAEEAAGLAERLRYPVGVASGIEARGAATADPALLAEAEAAWNDLGRPDNARRSAELAARLGARR